MGGNNSKMKKEAGALENSFPTSQVHPLLIPLVAEKIFSNLDTKDLLTVRRVCSDWHDIGTEAYRNRKSIMKSLCFIRVFNLGLIDVMAGSKRIPIVRWSFNFEPSPKEFEALLRFLTFASPSASSIGLSVSSFFYSPLDDELVAAQVSQVVSRLDGLGPEFWQFPELEYFYVGGAYDTNTHLFRDVVIKITQRIIAGSPRLQAFPIQFPFHPSDGIIQALPRSLNRLHFTNTIHNTHGGVVRDIHYDEFMDSDFHFRELVDPRDNADVLGLVDFLSAQKQYLRRVHVNQLEGLYRHYYATFPQLILVDKIRCEVNCNSTFEFVNPFSNVSELTISLTRLSYPVASRMKKFANNLLCLPQHPSVRKLHFCSNVLFGPEPGWSIEELVSIPVLSHCFPQVTQLSITTGESARILTDVFAHFPNLVWLYVDFYFGDDEPRAWESVLSGIPVQVCEAMNTVENYEEFGDEPVFDTGLTHLKRLRTLELGDTEHRFEHIFTGLMVHRIFGRMESLKEICFVQEDRIPEVCLPFVEPLRVSGIDLYRMKRKVDALL